MGYICFCFKQVQYLMTSEKKKMLASGPTRFQPYILICPWPHFERYVTQTLPRNEQKNETKNTNYLEVLTHLLRTEL